MPAIKLPGLWYLGTLTPSGNPFMPTIEVVHGHRHLGTPAPARNRNTPAIKVPGPRHLGTLTLAQNGNPYTTAIKLPEFKHLVTLTPAGNPYILEINVPTRALIVSELATS